MTLYVHIPFCLKQCGYCDFFRRTPERTNFFDGGFVGSKYIAALENQIAFLKARFCDGKEVASEKVGASAVAGLHKQKGLSQPRGFKSVYIGGGTPSLIRPDDLIKLCRAILGDTPAQNQTEFTIEANPDDITEEFLCAADAGGINRLSLGIQSTNDKVLSAVGRRATSKEIRRAVDLIQRHWKHQWSADLIAGLPFQTRQSIEDDIFFVTESGAAHISLYSLTIEKDTALEKAVAYGELPYNEDKAATLWLYARDLLERRGLAQYEISNFARAGFESAHNTAYWRQEDYLGAGAGATGTIYGRRGESGRRFLNTTNIEEYAEFWLGQSAGKAKKNATFGQTAPTLATHAPGVFETLDEKTKEFEFLMTGFRTLRGVSKNDYRERFGGDLATRLNSGGLFDAWQKRGNAITSRADGDEFFSLTKDGIVFLNAFLTALL